MESDAVTSHIPSHSSRSHSFLAEVLKEEPVEERSNVKDEKRAVTQEEIDKLLGQ